MSPLAQFLMKYGDDALKIIAKHPGISTGVGAAGLGAAALAGAKMGSDATVSALPAELLKRLGLSDEAASDAVSSVEDAIAYAQKHPIAATAIGSSAALGSRQMGHNIMDKIREMLGPIPEERRRK